jgi:ubiquinone/menaquinone biosynthesis C-methylase UbiE
MDALNLNFKEGIFDIVFDKATLDSLTTTENSLKQTATYMNEVYRVLKANGHFICVSSVAPDARLDHFRHKGLNWDIKYVKIRK